MIVHADLESFFRDEVATVCGELRVELSELTEFYVVNLLCEYARRGNTVLPGDEALALLYKRALEASVLDRIHLLKNLGDVSLYSAGFFAEYIERSLVCQDYYISMGGNAYSSLSDIMGGRRRGGNAGEVYQQLARKFTALVEVLMSIAERARIMSEPDSELLRLYTRWQRTGSERIRRLLLEKGLLHSVTKPDDTLQ
jgi:hypothetical protein